PHCLWPATATSLPRPSRQPRLFSLGAPAPTVTYTLSLHDALPIWRLRYAIDYRRTVMGEDFSNCRLIFGEADQFPGLTVDRFGDILVAQVLSLGIEQRKGMLFAALAKIFDELGEPLRGIYERNDVAIRELEGMEQYKGFYPLPDRPLPDSTTTTITE